MTLMASARLARSVAVGVMITQGQSMVLFLTLRLSQATCLLLQEMD